jgi:DNA polymerase-1
MDTAGKSRSSEYRAIAGRRAIIFRTLFIPRYGVHIIADVSQQEPRLTALVSKDKNLIGAFVNREDIHTFVTRMIFEDQSIVKADPRRKIGKETGLGVVYGLTAQGLTAKLKEVVDDPSMEINDEKSQGYIDLYFQKFPRVKSMLDRVVADGHKNEFVTTYYGRRCWINIHGYGWENNCKNSPIQGGGADMTKMWQIRLWELCREQGVRYPMCLVVHDEIVLDVSPDEQDLYIGLLNTAFEQAIATLYPDSPVPFEFEHAEGPNWGAKK